MEVVKVVVEIIGFVCNAEFWRMGVLWTLSLIFSYSKLFCQGSFSPKSNCYHRCSPRNSIFASSLVPRPVCIITGATSGLGAAAAYALSKEGFHVVLVGRSSKLLSQAISDVKSQNHDACLKAFEVNLSSFMSILEFKHSLQQWLRGSNMHPSVQLLINNAGILATSCRVTSEGYDQMLATNYFGAFCLTKVLLPLLENSPVPSRVVNVTSFTHRNVHCRQADRETVSGKFFMKLKNYPYAHIYEYSKLWMLLFSYELHRKVGQTKKSQHLSIVAVDPGAVKTNIMREIPSPVSTMAYTAMKLLGVLQSSETGVSSIIDAALAPPVSIRTQNPLLQLWSGLLKNQDCVVAPSCATRNTLLDDCLFILLTESVVAIFFSNVECLVIMVSHFCFWIYADYCNLYEASFIFFQEVSGVYFFGGKGRTLNSSALSYDAKLARDLWDTSCNLFEELQLASRVDEKSAVRKDETFILNTQENQMI